MYLIDFQFIQYYFIKGSTFTHFIYEDLVLSIKYLKKLMDLVV
jgi:hypothetical protein